MSWIGLTLALACTQAGDGNQNDTAPIEQGMENSDDSGGASGDDTGDGETDEPEPQGSISGRMVDANGNGVSQLQMRLCMDSCSVGITDDDGAYAFGPLDLGDHTLQAVDFSDDPLSTPHAIISIDDSDRDLGDWFIPSFVTGQALKTAQEVTLDGGLTVLASPDGLTTGIYATSEEAAVTSVQIDPDASGLPPDGIDGDIAALWYLGTYDLQIDPAWAIGGSSDLSPGTYEVWTADNSHKAWVHGGTIEVDTKGAVTTTQGGLERLTTLILIQDTQDK